jgi:hypothetical protein
MCVFRSTLECFDSKCNAMEGGVGGRAPVGVIIRLAYTKRAVRVISLPKLLGLFWN